MIDYPRCCSVHLAHLAVLSLQLVFAAVLKRPVAFSPFLELTGDGEYHDDESVVSILLMSPLLPLIVFEI